MISAFIQAGGGSTRMGRNKALLPIGGRPCLEWVITAARAVTAEITVVTSDPQVGTFCREQGIALAADHYCGIGPLAGLHIALSRCQKEAALILACDLPFLTGEFLGLLRDSFHEAEAIVPLDARGRPQPLCAIYSVACLPLVTDLIEQGERRMNRVLEHLAVRFLAFSAIAHLPGAENFFWDLDTPEDYWRAQQRFHQR
ncbi:MAG: molybdenum cofactor guanylyltransferase [Blastocatellia bacterium]|nr:molybdenum cofactor guanylyltransferase [Blastocatellia bacterium]MCS7156905.1 molybdenum cofactor guanylyltransferase [Blastocatellia bacterium]MCX7752104.1 molybdenum cofactor guanylyltransferase [Blastocatellia bacterium]MDW8256197.1 molybdenum cofactor guanylyltransferase [Acidobacteriota bacterium]